MKQFQTNSHKRKG